MDVVTVDGNSLKCCGVGNINLGMNDIFPLNVEFLVTGKQLLSFDQLLGFDITIKLGRLQITESGNVRFSMDKVSLCAASKIDEPNLCREFDQDKNIWAATWK